MTLQQEKQSLMKELDSINDVEVIKAIKPFTRAELVRRAKKSEDGIKNGRTTTAKALKKEMRSW